MAKQTLDQRIAAALAANGSTSRDVLVSLIDEATKAIATAEETVRVNSALALDITNPEPDEADDKARTAERTIKRLTAALPRLTERVAAHDHEARIKAWNEDLAKEQAESDAIYEELEQTYTQELLNKLEDLYLRYRANERAVAALHLRAPTNDEKTKALEFSHARPHPRFWETMCLPSFVQEGEYRIPFVAPGPTQDAQQLVQFAGNAGNLRLTSIEDDRAELNRREAERVAKEEAEAKASLEAFYAKERQIEHDKLFGENK